MDQLIAVDDDGLHKSLLGTFKEYFGERIKDWLQFRYLQIISLNFGIPNVPFPIFEFKGEAVCYLFNSID